MYRRYAPTLARSCWRPCMRTLSDPTHILPGSSPLPGSLPIFATSRMQYASRGRGRGGGGGGGRGSRGRGGGRGGGRGALRRVDDDDDDEDEDDDEDDEFEDVPDPPGYEWDYETWNLLHQGRKEGELSRKWPLPMYKAREMVDFHMIKNRLDGLKIITDPKLEYELKKQAHERMVDHFKRTQAALDEIELRVQEKKKLEESGDKQEILQVTEGETKSEDSENQISGDKQEILQVTEGETKSEDSENQITGEVVSDVKDVEGASGLHVAEGEIDKVETTALSEESKEVTASMLDAGEEAAQEEGSGEGRDLSAITTAVDEIIKDVLSMPEVTTLELVKDMSVETKSEEAVEDDGVNVFDYDKWVAYREQQIEKRYAEEEERKHATLRWKIQLVLGPGDVVHPANRKASVSVYVRELCLSKYAKQRLLALVGKRYNAPKDELTIVSERFPHRYENQKDVLRTLLALIEESKKADQLVYDARIGYMNAKNAELKKAEASVAVI